MNNIINDTKGLMEGVELCASLARSTYGGNGSNIVVEDFRKPYHLITNDFQTMVQAIQVKDNPAVKIGVDLIKELVDKQDKVSGNGRKTTCIMAEEILKGAFASSSNKLQLKRDLDALIPFIESEIDKRTTKITVNEVKGVATTASESEETGALLQEIYQQIGPQGILNIEGSKTYETSYKITNGVRFEMTGMLSPEMVTDGQSAIYEHPLILITKKKISTDDDINPLLREFEMMEDKRPLVIFTNDMDSGIASMLVNLHKGGITTPRGFFQPKILVIKAPTMWQDYVFEDFAKCVGATIVEDKTGLNFKNLKLEHLGTCDKIEVDQEDTVLIGIKDITEHMKALHAKGDNDSLLRLSWLASKSCLLKLGANSQTELSLKRLKANDANRSTYLALQYGVVKGGGLCLADIAKDLISGEANIIMSNALSAPARQAMNNFGVNGQTYINLITPNIVDASQTIKLAVRNALGIASTVLTSSAVIYIPKKTPEEIQIELAYKQNNPFGQ